LTGLAKFCGTSYCGQRN